ncbi:MAG: asparagine synthase-related protein [Nitrospiraceae bacterium]
MTVLISRPCCQRSSMSRTAWSTRMPESRVPFLDHPLVEFAATIPSNVKFMNGRMKHALKNAMVPRPCRRLSLNRTGKCSRCRCTRH